MTKKAEVLTFIFLLCLAVSCFVFAGTHTPWDGTKWDVASPDIDQPHGNTYKEIYDLRKGIAIRMNKEHIDLATSSAGGEHVQGSAVAWHLATASIPALQPDGTALAATDNGRLWHDITTDIFYVLDDYSDPTVDGGWIPMGHYLGDIAINTNKFTVARATGNTVVAGTLTVAGAIAANGTITLGAGDDLIGSSTSDITINTNKFTVAGASGNTVIAGTLGVTGASTFTAGITANGGVTLGAGDDLIGSSTSDITINTNKFTVAGASGNTVIAGTASVGGTLDVTGNIDPTTYETTNGGFLDEDDMASDSATGVASQQSIKKYVDDNTDGDVPTPDDSESNTMLRSHAYLAQGSGFVTSYGSGAAGYELEGYVDTDNNPVDGGALVAHSGLNDSGEKMFIMFFVPNGKYFEVISDRIGTVIYWTPLVSGGAAPVDQD